MADGAPTRRRWYRRRWVLIAGVMLLALALGAGVFLVWVASGVPGSPGKYRAELRALVAQYQPADGPDARPVIDAVIAIKQDVENGIYGPFLERRYPNRPDYTVLYVDPSLSTTPDKDEEGRTLALRAIRAFEEAGGDKQLDQLVRCRRTTPVPHTGSLLGYVPPNYEVRELARMLRAGMDVAGAQHDDEAVVRIFEYMLALGRSVRNSAFLLDHLVALAIDALALDGLREVIQDFGLGEAALAEAVRALDRQLPLTTMQLCFEGERLIALDEIEECFTDDGAGDGRALPGQGVMKQFMRDQFGMKEQTVGEYPALLANLAGLFMAGKQEHARVISEEWEFVKKWSATPRSQRSALGPSPHARLDALPARYAAAKILVPPIEKAVSADQMFSTMAAAAKVMLAIELHRAATGKPPERLADLVPKYLPELPRDTFSDAPLGYKVVGGGQRGRDYLLYSYGADRTDNGGTAPAVGDDTVALLPRGAGYDFIINKPRPRATQPKQPPVESDKGEPGN